MGDWTVQEGVVHRADHLRRVPAAIRFISAEPLLGPLEGLDLQGIDWLIAGGERPRRPPLPAGVALRRRRGAVLLKQLGGWPGRRGHDKALLDGRFWRELPTDDNLPGEG